MANIAQAFSPFSRLFGNSKFWVALIGLVASVLVMLGVSAEKSGQIVAVITALSGAVILGIAIENGGEKSNPSNASGASAPLQPAPPNLSASPVEPSGANAVAGAVAPLAKLFFIGLLCGAMLSLGAGCASSIATTQPDAEQALADYATAYDAVLQGLTLAKADGLLSTNDVAAITPALNAAQAALQQMQANSNSGQGGVASVIADFEAAIGQLTPYLDKANATKAAATTQGN